MKEIKYPVIFRVDEEDPEFVNATIPDIWGGVTCGKGLADAIFMAKDLLKLMLETAPAQCNPPHSLEHTKKAFPNDKVLMIKVKYKEPK